jgi:Na+/proline symporter/signal transduction histidine kinase
MNFNPSIDSAIFIAFLTVTFFLGLYSSYGIKNIKEFAVGDRNFSTGTLVATIVATWISGEFFYSSIYETYSNGFYTTWISMGDHIYLFCIGMFFSQRMREFLGKLSIAHAMGDLFGKNVRIVTAIVGFISMSGLVGVQLKLTGLVFEHALSISNTYGIIIATIIVTLYSSLGGIKSVTFTDIIQFITFSITIPIVAYVLLTSVDSMQAVKNTLNTNPVFNLREVLNFSNPQTVRHLFLFLCFAIPTFSPVTFQRISMASSTRQIKQSFIIATIVCVLLDVMLQWIAILILSISPSLDSSEIFKLVILDSFYIGLKGLVLSGIMAMIMSTVDSCINAASVLIVHDFCNPLKFSWFKNELISARLISLIIGICSLFISLREGSLLDLLVMTFSFYMPIVSLPFIMAILGFRSSEKSVLLGMLSGFTAVIMWDYVFKIEIGNSIPIGMLANLIVLMASHYLLKQPGGWVGIKQSKELIEEQRLKKISREKLWLKIKNFSIIGFCKQNYPKGDGLIALTGLFIMITMFTSTQSLPPEYLTKYSVLMDYVYPLCFVCSSLLMSYPLWLPYWKEKELVAILWNFVSFFILVCFSFFMVLISNFSPVQLIAFMANIFALSTLNKWQSTLFYILFGVGSIYLCDHYFMHLSFVGPKSISVQFQIIYLLLLICTTLMAFLKPRQDYQELIEEKNDHLSDRIKAKDEEVEEALALKGEFIRNIQHEYHAPMTGMISTLETLHNSYDKLNDNLRKGAVATIFESSAKLQSYDDNIKTLARLEKPNYELKKKNLDLGNLLLDRINICRKLYEKNPGDREFIIKIEEGLILSLDKNYIIRLIDNLIINAIIYCPKGKIQIDLHKTVSNIELTIQDEGIGIPVSELLEIFDPFKVSSKTKTPAGGRGVGLAVCKRIAEIHEGSIMAESDGIKGTLFRVML